MTAHSLPGMSSCNAPLFQLRLPYMGWEDEITERYKQLGVPGAAGRVTLRAATSEDRDAIVAVFLVCWQQSYAGILPAPVVASMTDDRATALWTRVLSASTDTVGVAERDGTVVGITRFAAGEGVVHSLYVSPQARGLGLGTRLLDTAYDGLRSGGARSAVLWVFVANAPAIVFYRRRGWRPDGNTRTQEEFGAPELRLSRDVRGTS